MRRRPRQRRRGLQKLGGKKLKFADRQLQISDRGDYGCSNVQFCLEIPPKMGDFQPLILYFWKKIFQQDKIWGGGWPTCPHPPRRH